MYRACSWVTSNGQPCEVRMIKAGTPPMLAGYKGLLVPVKAIDLSLVTLLIMSHWLMVYARSNWKLHLILPCSHSICWGLLTIFIISLLFAYRDHWWYETNAFLYFLWPSVVDSFFWKSHVANHLPFWYLYTTSVTRFSFNKAVFIDYPRMKPDCFESRLIHCLCSVIVQSLRSVSALTGLKVHMGCHSLRHKVVCYLSRLL